MTHVGLSQLGVLCAHTCSHSCLHLQFSLTRPLTCPLTCSRHTCIHTHPLHTPLPTPHVPQYSPLKCSCVIQVASWLLLVLLLSLGPPLCALLLPLFPFTAGAFSAPKPVLCSATEHFCGSHKLLENAVDFVVVWYSPATYAHTQ